MVSRVTFKSVVSAVTIEPYAKDGNANTDTNRNKHARCRTKRVLVPELTGLNRVFIRAIFLILKREIKDIL